VKWICDTLESGGVPVRRFVASGGLPVKSPLLIQIYADVLDSKIQLAESDQSVALGAAILGCLAADPEVTGYPAMSTAVQAMARQREDLVYRPDLDAKRQYAKLYEVYRSLTACDGQVAGAMRALRQFSELS
jgi:L-ribulokinase